MPTRLRLSGNSLADDVPETINDVPVVLKLRWNIRTADWRISVMRQEDEVYLLTSRRLSPGWAYPLLGGSLQIYGQDPYDRQDLGRRLGVWWWSDEDLAAQLALRAGDARDPDFTLVE